MKIAWLDNAKEDMVSIFAYYEDKSIHAAVRIYNSIIEETNLLINHPHIGKIEPLLENLEYTFRSFVIQNGLYKIIYFIDDDIVFISRVWSCRQNPKNIKI